jgi:hypothetical protein
MISIGFNLKGGFWNRVTAMTGTDDVVELRWRLGFNFEGKLAWGCVEEVQLNLYRGVGEVWED